MPDLEEVRVFDLSNPLAEAERGKQFEYFLAYYKRISRNSDHYDG